MKPIKNLFESIIIILVLACLFHKEQRRWWQSKILWAVSIVLIISSILGYQIYQEYNTLNPYQDCVPRTMQRIFPQYTLSQLYKICNTERDGTAIIDILRGWQTLTTNDLNIVYNINEIEDGKQNLATLSFFTTYLWLGILTTNKFHMALVRFTTNEVIISNSQFYPGTTNYYTMNMNYDDFFQKTYLIFASPAIPNDIRFK